MFPFLTLWMFWSLSYSGLGHPLVHQDPGSSMSPECEEYETTIQATLEAFAADKSDKTVEYQQALVSSHRILSSINVENPTLFEKCFQDACRLPKWTRVCENLGRSGFILDKLGLGIWSYLTEKEKTISSAGGPLGDLLRSQVFDQNSNSRPELALSQPRQFGIDTTDVELVTINSGSGYVKGWYMHARRGRVARPDRPTILYLHGVGDTRGQMERVGLYNVLLSSLYEVLAIDYRDFGDSSPTSIDENTVVEDAQAALTYLEQKGVEDVVVWGHSLGAAVATHALAKYFQDGGSKVLGVVLEAPFNNFTDEFIYQLTTNPEQHLAIRFAMMELVWKTGDVVPWKALSYFNMEFNSDKWIKDVTCPVLILHAEDDVTVPIRFGRQLYEDAKEAGKTDIEFKQFPVGFGLGHNFIYLASGLDVIIEDFIDDLVDDDMDK